MEIIIRGDKVAVTDAIREQINNKLSRLDKYFENSNNIKAMVNIRINNLSQIIEVTIPTRSFTLRREESNEDLYTAIDIVVDKLERQIRKNKTKLNNRFKNVENKEFNFDYEIKEDEEVDSKIKKRKDLEMKPMDEEEAILQAELIGHDFFVFKNINEECVSVLYKRKDESYGIINVK